jgi:hypothetical protein
MLSACSRPSTATARLALDPAPPDVASISVSVFDVQRGLSVASATAAASQTTFELEVPAEIPLEFRVVARTSKPGPPSIGAMPAYYASSVRTIALGSQEVDVALTVHKAGVLTLSSRFGQGVGGDPIDVRLEAQNAAAPALALSLDPNAPLDSASVVFRTGRYDAQIALALSGVGGPARSLRGARGLYVAPELESIALVDVETATVPLMPTAPAALLISLFDARGAPLDPPDVVPTSSATPTPVTVQLAAVDGRGMPVTIPEAPVSVSVSAPSPGIVAGSASIQSVGLPVTLGGFAFTGLGRFVLRGSAKLADGRTIEGSLHTNALRAGIVSGRTAKLILALEKPEALRTGGKLAIDLVDARGLYAQTDSGLLDLSDSDPWIFFEAGPGAAITARARGHVEPSIARPSAPRGIPVVLRASLTSTASNQVVTSTLALPNFAP